MSAEPQIKVLPYHKRQRFFWFLCLVFVIALPTLIFYTSGNRVDFSNPETNIISMGGIYLNSGSDDSLVYLNELEVEDRRLFRQAFYIQNVEAGKHRLHVQQENLQTWIKELPVYPYIVTEAQSFTLPNEPQIRLISERVSPTGTTVVFQASSTAELYGTTTNSVLVSTSSASSTFAFNPEYIFVEDLFSATNTATLTLRQRFQNQLDNFTFSSELSAVATSATTTVAFQDIELRERNGEVIARWQGDVQPPYYFCVTYQGSASTSDFYGTHVAIAIDQVIASSSVPYEIGDRVCRDEIRIDRKWQDVLYFGFVPGSADFVLLQLEDGVYVTEIDDRSWQNTQLLYPGTDLQVVVDGGQIFVFDGQYYFEVFTERPS